VPRPSLLARIGVSRLALIGGLDRSGVAVACATRPRGHVLQVCNGKGLTDAQALWSAAMEAAELWASERLPGELTWSAPPTSAEVWGPETVPASARLRPGALWPMATRRPWVRARELHTGRSIWLPAAAVWCNPPGSGGVPDLGIAWTSNGLGAHPTDGGRALRHALLELVERDLLARALPSGWTRTRMAETWVDPRSLRSTPDAEALVARLAQAGLDALLFDLDPGAPSGVTALPLAGALILDMLRDAVPVTAGYAAGVSRAEARLGALTEAAQSRLTDIHGAREDVAPGDVAVAGVLRRAAASARTLGRKRRGRRRSTGSTDGGDPGPVLRALGRAGHARVAVVELASAGEGAVVMKAVVPGLRLSELL
jgi:ribosomal protein S12 methylthiotransferase accessory factor